MAASSALRPDEVAEPIASSGLKPGEVAEPIAGPSSTPTTAPTQPESSAGGRLKSIGRAISDISIPSAMPEEMKHVPSSRTALSIAAPIAALAIPGVPELEGIGLGGLALRSLATGIGGGVAEIMSQGKERLTGQRKAMDWEAVGRSAGLNAAFEFGFAGLGKGLAEMTGAGKFAGQAPEVGRAIAAGKTVTGKGLQATADSAKQEAEAKMTLDTLGQRLGMTEEQSRGLVNAYDEGRAVGESFYKADRQVQGEMRDRYDQILGPHQETEVGKDSSVAMGETVNGFLKWAKDNNIKSQIRPSISGRLKAIAKRLNPVAPEEAEPVTPDMVRDYRKMQGLPPLSDTEMDAYMREYTEAPEADPAKEKKPVTVGKLRGWQTELRTLERTQSLTDAEKAVVGQTERALHHGISSHISDPEALDAVDADYGVFKSNFRTFWKAIKDKKSLAEVGDAIYDQMGHRPDALRYMLQAADRAGQGEQMRMAFVNKVWRESQVAGGPVARAEALKNYVAKFGPGAKGEDVLHLVMGNKPGITQSVGQFVNRISDMSAKQEALKNPVSLSRISRNIQFRMIIGSLAGGGLSYAAFGKDPVKAFATGAALLAGMEGLNWAITRPGVSNAWARWITTNPEAPAFITRGSELLGLFAADQAKKATASTP